MFTNLHFPHLCTPHWSVVYFVRDARLRILLSSPRVFTSTQMFCRFPNIGNVLASLKLCRFYYLYYILLPRGKADNSEVSLKFKTYSTLVTKLRYPKWNIFDSVLGNTFPNVVVKPCGNIFANMVTESCGTRKT